MGKKEKDQKKNELELKVSKLLPISGFYSNPTPEETLESLESQLSEEELEEIEKLYNERLKDLPQTHGKKLEEAKKSFRELVKMQEQEPANLIVNWREVTKNCLRLFEEAKDSAEVLGTNAPQNPLEALYQWREAAIKEKSFIEEIKKEEVKNRLNQITKGDWSEKELEYNFKDQSLVVCPGAEDLLLESTYLINHESHVYLIPTIMIGSGCWANLEDQMRVNPEDMHQIQVTAVLYRARKTLRKAYRAAREARQNGPRRSLI